VRGAAAFLSVGLALAGAGRVAAAAGVLPPDPRYVFEHVGEEKGFATRTVVSLCQDREGFLWVGTLNGLHRFDGASFQLLSGPGGVPETAVYSVREAPDGTLFVSTGAGLYQRARGRFEKVSLPAQADSLEAFEPFAFDGRGRLLVATSSGLLRRTDGVIEPIGPPLPVSAVHASPAGELWCASGTRAFRLTPTGAVAHEVSGLPGDAVRSFASAPDGTLWIRTARHLLRRDGDRFVLDDDGLPGGNDYGGPFADRFGELWVPTPVGLYRREAGRWRRLGRAQGMGANAVIAVTEDREGALWIGFGGAGLDRWPGRRLWSAWGAEEGLPNEVVWGMVRDPAGRLLIATSDGLAIVDPGRPGIRVVNERDGLAGRTVRHLAAASDGSVWALSVPGGLSRIDPSRGTARAIHDLPEPPVNVSASPDGTPYLVSRNHVFRLGDRLLELPFPSGLEGMAGRLVAANGGVLWERSRSGLFRFDGTRWRLFTEADGLLPGAVDEVGAVTADEAWVRYRSSPAISRVRLRGGGLDVRHFRRSDGLLDTAPFFIGRDAGGRVFLGGENGISVVAPDGRVRSLTRADGLIWNDCSDGAFLAEPDGSVLVGTSRGLARYDPTGGEELPGAPAVALTSVTLGGREAIPGGEVPWSRRLLVARFAALTYRSRGDVRFRYRLSGLESEATETALREARYPALPAGTYRFEVSCRSAAGLWSARPAAFDLTILPPWWQTWPFRLGVAVVVLAAGAGAVKLRVARLERRQAQLEAQVTERTRLLDERNRDLQRANLRLGEAQKRLADLQLSAPDSLGSLGDWGRRLAGETARMAGLEALDVFRRNGETVTPLFPTTRPVPSADELRAAAGFGGAAPRGTGLVPVLGPTGELHGALAIDGSLDRLGDVERQLLETLARHLGTTLDMASLRRRLQDAQNEREASRVELHRRGIDTLRECPRCGRCYDQRLERCEADGAELASTRLLPLRLGGRYRLRRLLGEGGMGAVFLAVDEATGLRRAVKIVRAEHLNDVVVRTRFEREAQLVARIAHPGVVSHVDSGELPDGSRFLVMELLEGFDLGRILEARGPGTPAQVAEVLRQAGAALQAAHLLGVLHRDLKPSNLFLQPRPDGFEVKVVDFGLAKSMGEKSKATQTGFVVGSPMYMSPEQIREESLDGRSDLFSLASVGYELLTGVAPFEGPNVAEIFTRILQQAPASFTRYLPGFPPDVEAVYTSAFEKKPARRPAGVGAWVARVVPALEGVPPTVSGWPIPAIRAEAAAFVSGFVAESAG